MGRAGLLVGVCTALISGCATLQPLDTSSLPTDSDSPSAYRSGPSEDDGDLGVRQAHEGEAESAAPEEPQSEAAEEAAEHKLWTRIRNGFALPDANDRAEVQDQIAFYARHGDYLRRVMERAEPYLCYILDEVDRRHLPTELVLLPVVESAFRPEAYSGSSAAGLWQFTPGTARHFGLRRSQWYDGRRDVHASTQAALDYLELLNSQFDGDWFLTLAAYNAGGGTVSRAMRRNQALGQPTDYWSLALPEETTSYVPKLLAVAEIIGNPADHGVDLPDIPDEPYLTRVSIDSQVDLATAARLADISVDDIYRLNPGFTRGATDPQGPFYLLLPVENAPLFRKRLAGVDIGERVQWDRYRIRRGDTLAGIARKFRIAVNTLREANQLKDDRIHVGRELLIPASDQTGIAIAANAPKPAGRDAKLHVVQSNDTLSRTANQYGVSVADLLTWNHLSRDAVLRPGQKLKVWVKVSDRAADRKPEPTRRRLLHTVRRGESLFSIAKRYKVSVDKLRQWNRLSKGKPIQPGDTLTVHTGLPADSI